MRKPKTISLLGSRSSGVGQNIREWWVGEKNCVIDGNATGLRWLSIVVERAKKTMGGEDGAEGRNSKFRIFAPENVRLTQVIGVRNSSLFAGNMSHVLVRYRN